MAALTGTYGLVKPQTLAFQVTLASAADTQSNADLQTTSGLAALTYTNPVEPSALKLFLGSLFGSDAAAETAFRALGGRIDVRCTSGLVAADAIMVQWKAAGPATTPSLAYTGASGGFGQVLEVVITLPHSIIQ